MKAFNKFKTFILMMFLATTLYPVLEEAPAPVQAVDTKAIYLKTNENWRKDGAKFAAYVWAAPDISPKWFPMTPLTDAEDEEFFSVNIPVTPYDSIIFARMGAGALSSTYTWDDRWNQSTNLVLDFASENNLYVINEGSWGKDKENNNDGEVIGYWSEYLPNIIDPDPDPDPNVDPGAPVIEPAVFTIHYYRNDSRASLYDLWLWGEGESGKGYPFSGKKTIGKNEWRTLEVASTFFEQKQYLNLIIRRMESGAWAEQTPDIKIKVSDFPRYSSGETFRRDFFLVDMETVVYKTADEALGPKILDARFIIESGQTPTSIQVKTYFEPDQYTFLIDKSVEKSGKASATKDGDFYTFKINITSLSIDVRKEYIVRSTFIDTTEYSNVTRERSVSFDAIFNSSYFENNFTYDGDDLGVTYTPTATTFKVWAPISQSIKVNIYEYGTPKSVDSNYGYDVIYETIELEYAEKGVWSKTVSGDYHGKYYTLVANNAGNVEEFTDPYAKAAGINGVRGMIVDFSKTNPTGWENVTLSEKAPTEIVPYELHVSDLTADASWNGSAKRRRKFLGLIQEGTMYKDEKTGQAVKTGFDHILELGVNAVQILPFYDQANDETKGTFNWGYNPQNYNVLEGMYSSNPHNGIARIYEFKQVVQAFAAHDIRIIMDVVYNHVSSISQHSFTKLVPGYYFRYYENGAPNNSSGVGNVTASERIMMENFMRDSTAFWAEEYKLGGFRFDLMGLHTVKAMNTLAAKLKTIRNDMVIYGEPWAMHDYTGLPDVGDLATQDNIYKMEHVGAFNDQGRDAIKGSSWDNDARTGWVQESGKEIDKIIEGTRGKITGGTNNPSQVVNYISVHDNYTIYDHLQVANKNHKDSSIPLAQIKKQALQAEAISLLSQGIGFIHAGSEILRTKRFPGSDSFDHNSYATSHAINAIKWSEKWDNLDFYNNYRQMIALKRHATAFNYDTRTLVDNKTTADRYNEQNNIIKITYRDDNDNYEIYHYGAGSGNTTINGVSNMEVVLDTSGARTLGTKINTSFTLAPNTSLVLRNVRNRSGNDPTIVNRVSPQAFVAPTTPEDIDWETPLPPGAVAPIPPTDPEPDPNENANNTLKIVLIASGSAFAAAGIGLGTFFIIRKKRAAKKVLSD